MRLSIEAACGCHTGKLRKNNEDNFFFDGRCLERVHTGLRNIVVMENDIKSGLCLAVFDGMGGENFGEYASFVAAHQLQQTQRTLKDYFIPEKKYLHQMIQQQNDAVVQVQKEMCTERIGSTAVSLHFLGAYAYVCNVGDSRAYRLRDGEFLQLSRDHVDKRPGGDGKKAPLTQYLGFGNEDMQIEPYIAKGAVQKGDLYLLCSDGLTDMLTNFEISDIMLSGKDAAEITEALIQAALDRGGRDNITVIVCKIL